MQDRTILHVDCNSFFASVEMTLNPSLRGVPLAVCGDPEKRHGIVLAKNELAKSYGIVTTETIASARRKCNNLVVVLPHYEEYERYSEAVMRIFERYTEEIEPFGIDESWLDVTASYKLFGSGEAIADRIRREVKEELGITVSVGVSFNKVFAKLGSDYKKPDAITSITRENFKEIVYPLPVGDLLFVGKKTVQTLNSFGITIIGELAECSEIFLTNRFGKMGTMLYRYANGLDTSPVVSRHQEAKSISNGYTFRYDIIGFDSCRQAISRLAESIGTKLRKSKLKCSGVSLKMKDVFLHTVSKQISFDKPTDITERIAEFAARLLPEMWEENKATRTITVSVFGLVDSDSVIEQITLFDDFAKTDERTSKRESIIDSIREKYGDSSILPLSSYLDDTGLGIK